MTRDVPPDPAASGDQKRVDELMKSLMSRLRFIVGNVRLFQKICESRLSFNESIVAARQAAGDPKRVRFGRKRLHVEVELLINHHAWVNAGRRLGDNAEIDSEDVIAARRKMLNELEVPRGAPSDPRFEFYLHSAMTLIYELTGHRVTASKTRESVYDPHVKPEWAGTLLLLCFGEADDQLTMTRLSNLIDKANKGGVLEGKRFCDFFPLDFARATSSNHWPPLLPGYKLQPLAPAIPIPIYSS